MKKFLLFILLLLALIATALLAYYFCAHKMDSATLIQNDISKRAQTALDKNNMGWANLSVDGRDITLSGFAPSEEAKNVAEQAVRIYGYNIVNNQISIAKNTTPDPATDPQKAEQNNASIVELENTKKVEEPIPLPSTANNSDNPDDATQNIATTVESKKVDQQPPSVSTDTDKNKNNNNEQEIPKPPPIETIKKVATIKQVKSHKACQAKFNRILKTPIYFKSASYSVQKKSIPVLNKLASTARACANFKLIIHGYTDSTGKRSLNKKLSRGRAKAVVKYLIRKKINPKRLVARGHGASRPIASNRTNAGRARNRRIEITIEDKQ